MKALQCLLFVFLVFNMKAQDCIKYKFVDENNILKYKYRQWDSEELDFKITFSKDSFLFNDKYYRKWIVVNNALWTSYFDTYFRQENGKVYVLRNDIEKLLYDFCLDVGDTFDSTWKVMAKNTVTTNGNNKRNKLILRDTISGNFNVWVEGIGSYSIHPATLDILQLCEFYTRDQSHVFVPEFESCGRSDFQTQISHKNQWFITVPAFQIPGYDFSYTFTEDSFLLDNKYYKKKLTRKSTDTIWQIDDSKKYYREYLGRIFSKSIGSEEELSYNYAADIGDTLFSIPNSLPNFSNYLIVTDIDEIVTLDGKTRRHLTLQKCQATSRPVHWIEGVGETESNDGLELGCIVYDPTLQFNCMLSDGQVVYSKNHCISDVNTTFYDKNITIKPNPAYEFIEIMSENESYIQVTISDIFGKTHISASITFHEKLDISNLDSGIYLCNIKGSNGLNLTKKWVKI